MPAAMKTVTTAGPRALRLGFLALTDAAPLIVAQERGFFAARGLKVALQRQVGWATIREKIVFGELDAAPAPAPMLWATRLGLGCAATRVLTGFVFNLNGNVLVLSAELHAAGVRDAASLRSIARSRHGESRLTIGVVFPYSVHHLMVRQWLVGAGIQPDRDVRIAIVPPAQMYRNLHAGTIDGFCAGEPWGSICVRAGVGWCPTWSAAQLPGHIEKVLMVTERFATARAEEHGALVGALTEAAAWCDDPANREALVALLGSNAYLNVPARVLLPALTGRFDAGFGRVEQVPDFVVFHRGGINEPDPAKAAGLQQQLVVAGILPVVDQALPRELFRPDLFRTAAGMAPPAAAAIPSTAGAVS